jgi:hypothetical protein
LDSSVTPWSGDTASNLCVSRILQPTRGGTPSTRQNVPQKQTFRARESAHGEQQQKPSSMAFGQGAPGKNEEVLSRNCLMV